MAQKLSVVLPCYNEALNLPALFQRLDLFLEAMPDAEIILVNNGSGDNSQEIMEREIASRSASAIRIVQVPENRGYGFGILSGLRQATSETLAWTHADIQTDPLDVKRAWDSWLQKPNGTTLVKGTRTNRKFMEAVFSFGMGVIASLALGKRLKEINAQPKLFSRDFFNAIQENAPNDFSLDLYFQYRALQKGNVLEIPVHFGKRTAGEAKGGSGSSWKLRKKLIKRSLAYIFQLRRELKMP